MEYLQNKNIFSSSLKTETENWIIWTYKAITEKVIWILRPYGFVSPPI